MANTDQSKKKSSLAKVLRKVLKVVAWIFASLIFLLILLYILIQIPAVQDFARGKIVAYLQGKLKTKVEIAKLSIAFPKRIVLQGVYFEDQKKDTLLAGRELRIDISLLKLLSNQVDVQYIELNDIKTHIYRVQPDTVFNFDYIVKAFVTEQTKSSKPSDTTSALKFNVGRIVLNNITTTFKDDVTGSDMYFYLGSFDAKIKTFDPFKLIFDLPSITVKNIDSRVHQYKPLITLLAVVDTSAAPIPLPSLNLNTLNFQNIRFNFRNDVSATYADLKIGEFATHFEKLNLQSSDIRLSDVVLNNTSTKISLGTVIPLNKTQNTSDTTTVVKTAADSLWNFQIAKIDLNNNDFEFDDNTKPHLKTGMDFSHLHIQDLTVQANNLNFTPAEYKGNIQQIAFTEQSGFNLRKFQTDFLYNDTSASLNNLLVQTDKTFLRDKVVLKYPSIQTLSSKPGELYVDIDLKHSSLAMRDMLNLAPQLATNLKGNSNAVLKLNTSLKGYVKNLSIPFFQLSGLNNTAINLSGNIKGLPDAQHAVYNINIAQFKTTKNDIYQLIPAKSIPSNIRIPNAINAKGYFKGTMNQFNTQLQLNSTSGNAYVKAAMRNKQSYIADVTLDNLNIGYLIKQDTMIGRVSLKANVKGSGFDYKTAAMQIQGTVKQAEFKGYNYQNLTLTANLNKGAADIQATMDDANIRFNLTASADIKQTYPTNLKLDLMLDTLNVNALHLMPDTIGLHGRIVADMPSTNPDFLTGNVFVNNLIITTPQRTISTDSISLVANATTDNKSISITSEFLKANLEGQFKLTEFGASLQQTINKYYTLPGYKSQKLFSQNWKLDATFYPSSLLVLQFIPGMKGSDSALIAASFNSEADGLTLSLKDRRLIYNEMQFDSLNVLAKTDASKLGFNISLQSAKTSSLQLYKTTLNGSLANNQLDAALVVNDNKGKPQYQLAALLNQIPNGIKVSLKPGNLLLNYSQWTVASDNYIQYDSMGVIVNNFKINQGNQSLSINSTSLNESAPIKVDFSNFEIATLTKIANQDSLLLGGVINGNALITNPTKNMAFTSDISIANLSYKKDTLGNATIKVNNQQANTFAADVALLGNGNDVKLNGLYYTGESRMDFKVNANSLNLATIKPFAAGQLNDIRGTAKANLNITGTIKQPKVIGDLHFENASVVPTMSGERFTLSNEAISFTDHGIDLNNFTLKDSTGNEAILSGNIYTTDFLNYRFNVDLNAQNFRVVNIAETTNKLYYGKLNVDANIKLRGDMNSPTADAYLRVNKETDFTVVLPGSNPEIVDRTGIVNFIDKDNPVIDSSAQKTILDSLTRQSKVKGIDVSANIETDSAAKFTMVIDERNGDALTLQGRADLTGGIDKSGKTSLTGNYELTHGSYQVSLSVLKRKFQIQKGSTITWTGDPTSAIVDIIAIYYVKTAPIDLVGPQLSGRPQAELTRYKERLPFEVYLKMQGELLKPLITFDINLPESELSQWPEVDTKLQQVRADESELNKQVFALLLLGRFVQENPFQSEAGGTTGGDIARQSASRILTEQLNQLAGSLIKGVDINFDVSSGTDYTTGVAQNRTDLNVGVSKKLLNDRLRVNIGSNFELEGSPAAGQQASNIAGDVSVDYQLSKDGRYMIRVYRKNEYEQVVEGQVIETGVSFILTMDYNKFNELFKNRKEKRQARKEVKESKKEPLPATPQ